MSGALDLATAGLDRVDFLADLFQNPAYRTMINQLAFAKTAGFNIWWDISEAAESGGWESAQKVLSAAFSAVDVASYVAKVAFDLGDDAIAARWLARISAVGTIVTLEWDIFNALQTISEGVAARNQFVNGLRSMQTKLETDVARSAADVDRALAAYNAAGCDQL